MLCICVMFYFTTLSGTTYEKGLLYALEKTKHKLDKVIVMVYDKLSLLEYI